MAEEQKVITPEQISKQNEMRKHLGKEPIAAPPALSATASSDTNTEIKENTDNPELTVEFQMAQLEQQRIDLENKNKQLEEERIQYEEKLKKIESGKRKASVEPETTVLSEEDKKRIALEYLGVSDISEVVKKSEIKPEPTEEEKQLLAQQRENDKIAYALQKNIFSKKELEEFISDTKNPTELVYSKYYEQQKSIDPELSDDDIRSEFEDRYALNREEGSRLYKRGQEEISLIYSNIVNSKHSKILNFDKEYANIEANAFSQKELENKIQIEIPRYKKEVEEVYNSLKTIPIPLKGKTYQIDIPSEIIDEQRAIVLSDAYAKEQIKNGWNKEQLRAVANAAIIQQAFSILVEKAADQYKFENEKGAHGIIERGTGRTDAAPTTRAETLRKYHGELSTPSN